MENAPKITLEQIQAPIADRIRSYERYIASILHSDNAYVGSISDYILGNRGKQLRPLLVLLSAALHGEIGQRSYMGASLVEMIHTASLIHDDVVDEAYVRRGKPSVNALWHARTAVLIGDYIFARTYHVCLQNKGWDMLTEVTRSIHEVSEGELIQTEQTENNPPPPAALQTCGSREEISVEAGQIPGDSGQHHMPRHLRSDHAAIVDADNQSLEKENYKQLTETRADHRGDKPVLGKGKMKREFQAFLLHFRGHLGHTQGDTDQCGYVFYRIDESLVLHQHNQPHVLHAM